MKFSINRKELIVILFSLTLLLLILNIVLTKVYKHSGNQSEKIDLYSGEIRNRFMSGLQNFGIKEEWITENKIVKKDDSLKYSYKVIVPSDLPIAMMLNEIKNSFQPGEITCFAGETKSNGNTTFLLASGGYGKLKAEFIYNPEIHRTACTIGFLVFGLNTLNQAELEQLIKTPEIFTSVLVPSKESLELSKRLRTNEKKFAIILNNDISDLDYKLSSSYSLERLKMSIRSILGAFSNTIGYLYNKKSDFIEESKFDFIEKEFEKRDVKFIDINKFNLIEESSASLDASFRRIVKESNESKTELIYISANDYLKVQPMILKYKMLGYKFINPSAVLADYIK
jgi:hypothetical protein